MSSPACSIQPMTAGQRISLLRLRNRCLRDIHRSDSTGMHMALYDQLIYVSDMLGMSYPELGAIGRTVNQAELPGV